MKKAIHPARRPGGLFLILLVLGVTLAGLHGQTLMHHWTFDTDGSDSVGTADATVETGASVTTGSAGQFGEALLCPSTAVGAVVPGASSPDLPVSDFTYTLWVKPNGSNVQANGSVMGNQNGGTSGSWMRVDGSTGFARVNGPGAIASGGSVPADQWTHLAMTVSSTVGITLYINGAPVTTNASGTSHVQNNNSNFDFGTRPGSGIQHFDGLIDDAAIYDGVLTPAQITNVRDLGAQNFNSGGGTTVDPDVSTVVAVPSSVPADGSTLSTITVTLKNDLGNPFAGKDVSLAGSTGNANITVVNSTTDANGEATFTVTSNIIETEVFTATDVTGGGSVVITQTANVDFVDANPDAGESTVVATPASVPADGSTLSSITVTMNNSIGSPISGRTVSLVGNTGDASISVVNATTDSNGEAFFTVSSSTFGTEVFTATDVTGTPLVVTQTAAVVFTEVSPTPMLLFYEGFDYSAGDLDGNGGWSVAAGESQVALNGTTTDTYSGTYSSVTTTGGYMYNNNATSDYASVALGSSVTSTFTDGSVTWLSLISVRGTNGAGARYGLAIGADALTGERWGTEMAGDGIGLTAHDNNKAEAAYWTPNALGQDLVVGGTDIPGGTGRDRFTIAKITWSDTGNDTVEWAFFDAGATIDLAAFNAAGKSTVSAELDQSTFDTLSFTSGYTHFDELRIATTFDLAVSGIQPALITSFEGAGASGVIDQVVKTIALEVPFGTDLATLAPTFTLNSGTCDQTSGAVPTPDTFADANPITYTVTDTSTDPDTVNAYEVTVTVGPETTPTTTLVINLGTSPAGTTIVGGETIASGPTNLPLPILPAGSILRSIDVALVLESSDNGTALNYASDISLLLDPTPGIPGGDYSLEITNGESPFSAGQDPAAVQLGWATGDNVPVTPLSDIKTDADFGTIDLATTGLFLGNAYKAPDWEAGEGGTWSGTITLTYDVASGGSEYGTWSGGELFDGDKNGDGVTNGIAFLLGAANPDEDASGQLPTATQSGGGLVLTFSCLDAASRGASVLNVQYSNDLGVTDLWSANTAAVPEPPGATVNEVIFVVSENAGDDTLNDVVATIPAGKAADGKLFGRLIGTEN